jgi:hypothetical protein
VEFGNMTVDIVEYGDVEVDNMMADNMMVDNMYDGRQYDGQQYDGQQYDGRQYDGQQYDGQQYDGPQYDGQQCDGQQYDGRQYMTVDIVRFGEVGLDEKSAAPIFAKRRVTYVVSPGDLVGPRIGLDGALKVNVVALLDVGRVQAGAQRQRRTWNVCKKVIFECQGPML